MRKYKKAFHDGAVGILSGAGIYALLLLVSMTVYFPYSSVFLICTIVFSICFEIAYLNHHLELGSTIFRAITSHFMFYVMFHFGGKIGIAQCIENALNLHRNSMADNVSGLGMLLFIILFELVTVISVLGQAIFRFISKCNNKVI